MAKEMRVVGTMSGTSLDGVDAAEIVTDGERITEFGRGAYRPYTDGEREVLHAALGRWSDVSEAARIVEAAHLEVMRGFTADIFAFHGQTLAHDPANGRTHQAGNGQALADALGATVVWDFRSEDVANEGQGAPLAPFYHHALARHVGAKTPVAFLNLGGVGNITWIDPLNPDPVTALLAFDTGPANALMDDLVKARLRIRCDDGGAMAARGRVNEGIVQAALQHPYLQSLPPKSLDRDDFAHLESLVSELETNDALATLAAVTARTVAKGLRHCPTPPTEIWVSGGGRHNETVMNMIGDAADIPVRGVEQLGLDGDMIEAQAFGFLAARVLRKLPTSSPVTTGVRVATGGGQVSFPNGSLTKLKRNP